MRTLSTLPKLVLRNAREIGAQAAQRQKKFGIWVEYDWAAIGERMLRIAAALSRMGLGKNQAVLLVGENEPENIWAELAVQALGARSVSLYPDISPAEMEYVALDSGATMAVAQDQEQVDKLLAFSADVKIDRIVYWDKDGMWSYDDPRLVDLEDILADATGIDEARRAVESTDPDDVACLAYTSGTTSKPKGVMCTHRYLLDNAARMQEVVQLQPGDSYLSYVPLAWGTEQYLGVTLAVTLPLTVHFPERPDQVPEAIREIAPHLLVFGARQWEALASQVRTRMLDAAPWRAALFWRVLQAAEDLEVRRREGRPRPLDPLMHIALDRLALHGVRDQLGLTRVRTALLGGSAMAPEAFTFFHALHVPLRNAYGCSEFGVLTGHLGERVNVETIGTVVPVDPTFGSRLEARVSGNGELEVRGGSGFRGYWNMPEKTAEKWRDGWFLTGDVVNPTSDEFVYIDRLQDMRVLASGASFSPLFLEVRLRFSPYIKDVLVIGDSHRPHVVALLNIDATALGQWAEAHKIPFGGYSELSQLPAVVDLIADEVEKVNRLLPLEARIRRFANIPKELDPDEGELTRTRKLRREVVQVRYSTLIEALYTAARTHHLKVEVTLQDGRRGGFSYEVTLRDTGTDAVGDVAASITPQNGGRLEGVRA